MGEPNPPDRPSITERKPYTEAQVRQHIVRNSFPASPETTKGRKCGDGRDRQTFVEALFGSDLGYVFAAQAALRDLGVITQSHNERKCISDILRLVRGEGENYVHTDDHGHNRSELITGCGANKTARKNADAFGLTAADFAALDAELNELHDQGLVERDVYEGAHNEGAVVLIKGKNYGVVANDQVNNSSVFVATVDIIIDRLRTLAKDLADKYGVQEADLYAKMEARWTGQTEIIRQRLARIGDTLLPVFEVEFDQDGIPAITTK